MKKNFNFDYKKTFSINSLILMLISITLVITLTIAYFYDDDNASNLINMSGKVQIEAVGEGDASIEDNGTSHLVVKLDSDYTVVMPNMPITLDANCKVFESNTSPLLRAKIEFKLINIENDETIANGNGEDSDLTGDDENIINGMYTQIKDIIVENNWYYYDGYFYYIGEKTRLDEGKSEQMMQEVVVSDGEKVVHFINQPIRFPSNVTEDFSGFAVEIKITFQGIQDFIPNKDEDGNYIGTIKLDNTIENALEIFNYFDNP